MDKSKDISLKRLTEMAEDPSISKKEFDEIMRRIDTLTRSSQ
jgi:DNA-binding transcriptional regulator WhiA